MNPRFRFIGISIVLLLVCIGIYGVRYDESSLVGGVTFPYSGTHEGVTASASIHDVCPGIQYLEGLCNGAELDTRLFGNQNHKFEDGIICFGGGACGNLSYNGEPRQALVNNANYIFLNCKGGVSGDFEAACRAAGGTPGGGYDNGVNYPNCTLYPNVCGSTPCTKDADCGTDSCMKCEYGHCSYLMPEECMASDGGGGGGSNTGGETGGNTGGDSGDNGSDSGFEPEDTGGSTGGDTGSDTGGSTGGDTGSDTGSDTGGSTGSDTGSETGGSTGGDTGGGTGSNSGGDTGEPDTFSSPGPGPGSCSSWTPSLCARTFCAEGSACASCCGPTTPNDCAGVDCNDGNACTTDTCNGGVCKNTPLDCNDGNACTTDTCSDGVCKNTPLDCSDGDSCTIDSCVNGTCTNTSKNCNDNNSCTSDSCDATTGQCANTKIISAECKTCENEPVCSTEPCFIKEPDTLDANGCITACGECTVHPYIPPPLPPCHTSDCRRTPRCPTPICAPIPEGCSADTSGGTDNNGCPLNPCGYVCPEDEDDDDCPEEPECPGEIYRLDTSPDCKEVPGGEICGCKSYECFTVAPVECCSSESVCTIFEINTGYGEDEEQFREEVEWMSNMASRIEELDLITDPQERVDFCDDLTDNFPRPEPQPRTAGTVSGETGGATDEGDDSGDEENNDDQPEENESDCDPISCAAPPEGCVYDITATFEECTCPPLLCDDDDDQSTGGSTSGTTSGATGGDTGGTTDGSSGGSTTGGSTGGTTSGTSGGTTGGDTGGATGGTTSGTSGGDTGSTTGGTTGGSTSGEDTGGTTSGTTGGNTGGSTGGSTGGDSSQVCGDGFVNQSFEQCDDGNRKDYDGCSSVCQTEYRAPSGTTGGGATQPKDTRDYRTQPVCGDGKLQQDEQCDDGNTTNNDGCSSTCLLESGTEPVCGDAILTIGESCDYGNSNADLPNFCRTNCDAPICGDGIIDDRRGEQCDNGKNNSYAPGACRPTCFLPYCGDGIRDASEQCDDGNKNDNDGCSQTCALEGPKLIASQNECGNGTLEPPEECDDGNNSDNDGCGANCTTETTFPSAPPIVASQTLCGNGILEPPEQCDDGNNRNNDGCANTCTYEQPGIPTQVAGQFTQEQQYASQPLAVRQQDILSLNMMQGMLQQQQQQYVLPQYQAMQQFGFPQYPNGQQLPYRLPLAQLQPLIQSHGPMGDTGPAAVAVIGAGAAAGLSWMRRRK